MTTAIHYTKTRSEMIEDTEQVMRFAQVSQTTTKRRPGRPRKDDKEMTPQTSERTSKTQKTVFDLEKFDDVKLVKTVSLGEPVTSVQEALSRLDNNSDALLAVINAGLDEKTVETARESADGWNEENEDGELSAYTGKFASEEQGKKIGAVVLSIAKVFGYDKSLSPEKKREIKAQAMKSVRENPAIIASLQNS